MVKNKTYLCVTLGLCSNACLILAVTGMWQDEVASNN